MERERQNDIWNHENKTALIISTTQVVCINLVMCDNPRLCSKENSREAGALNL